MKTCGGSSHRLTDSTHCEHRVFSPQHRANFPKIKEFIRSIRTSGDEASTIFRCATCWDKSSESSPVIFGARLHLCAECIFVGCWANGHIQDHHQHTLHYLAIDLTLGHIYCFRCRDYIYDLGSYFEPDQDDTMTDESSPRKDWLPNVIEMELVQSYSKQISFPQSKFLGLRGLNNLGNTCFMNSVLQTLFHNPLMRNFFLSDSHNRRTCTKKANGICLPCEMDYLYSEIYSGNKTPFSPHHILYSIWRYASSTFAGYEQQDAHEFLIALLNGLHLHFTSADPKPPIFADLPQESESQKNCSCMVHAIWNGTLRSDVTCTSCQHISTTYDPFFDVSLDLPNYRKKGASPKALTMVDVDFDEKSESLESCLERFTRPETLNGREKFFCQTCQGYRDTTKKLSFHMLPVVLCLHFKRFEQPSTKIETPVTFPETLDLTPFIAEMWTSTDDGNFQDDDLEILESHVGDVDPVYQLFGIVTHIGNMDNGHYICHVRHQNGWYKCDDAWITESDLEQVLSTNAYVLFYVKRVLDYEKE